ncbi:hypothetical protein QTP70_028167, partial [Hemibagrus guttatus]
PIRHVFGLGEDAQVPGGNPQSIRRTCKLHTHTEQRQESTPQPQRYEANVLNVVVVETCLRRQKHRGVKLNAVCLFCLVCFISSISTHIFHPEPVSARAMEEGIPFHFAFSDVVVLFLSLIFFLLDVVLDLLAMECLYVEKEYFSLGLLIFLLLGSSVVIQIFSWIWYSDPNKTAPETKVESFIRRHGVLGLVHICQLGVFLRFAAAMEISICRFTQRDFFLKRDTIHMKHDLSTLRLFEAFSENVPQLLLMTPFFMQMQEIQFFTVLKIISLAFSVLSYQRNMHAFVPEKREMRWSSLPFYFLWNLFLIGPRVLCTSLFASALPCYFAAHFFSMWTLLVLWAWWQKTDFMDSKAGEWLYRATVALIWYFSWFNVRSGSTKLKAIVYHVVMGSDTMLLLGLWWWWRSVESARLGPLPIDPYLLIAVLVTIYITGIFLRMLYYWKFHRKQTDLQMDENDPKSHANSERDAKRYAVVETDLREISSFSCQCVTQQKETIPARAMEEGFPFHLTVPDVCFSFLSLILFLADVSLDLWAVAGLYEEEKYFPMGLLIFLLLGSSVLMQIYSWIWYSDPDETDPKTKVEEFFRRHNLLGPVHIFQLGIVLRFAELILTTPCRYNQHDLHQKGVTVFLNHDLSMLRLFEAFSENTSQLVLMIALTVNMQDQQLFTVAKIVGSLSSLSLSLVTYHRSMRAFIPEKHKMGWSSSAMYFLWNLFLIGPRVVGVSLFASALPCHFAAHFLSLWTLLVLWAWWQKTDFMDSKAGEWLYRATVALIWYFTWFNVRSGSTKLKAIVYHVVMGSDTMLLLGLWWWWRSVESARLGPLPIDPYLLIAVLVTIYITGIFLRMLYYWKFHPNKPDLQIRLAAEDKNPDLEPQALLKRPACMDIEQTDTPAPSPSTSSTVTPPTQRTVTGIHKRMKIMAENFYY